MKGFYILLMILLSSYYIQAQNQNLSNSFVFDGEPYLSINPNNPQHMVVAWMGFKLANNIVIKTKVTLDGGTTWSTTSDLGHTQTGYTSADPSLQFDNNGNVYICYIDFNPNYTTAAVYVSKSTNGGFSWAPPVEVISNTDDPNKYPVDRPWMAIDQSNGPYQGNIYVTSMNLGKVPVSPPYNPYFIRSTDGGLSFHAPRYLDTVGYLAGNLIPQPMPSPSTTSNGTFYAIYPSYVLAQSWYAQYILAKSTDGGSTFTRNTALLLNSSLSTDSLAKKAGLLITNPADSNHLAFVYLMEPLGDLDLFIIESLDGGTTWTDSLRINDDAINNGVLQDLAWADFDNDGDLAICWRDRRNAVGSGYEVATEIWAAVRWKDSSNFSANFQISDVSTNHDTVLNDSGNDFMCVQLANDTMNVVWGDVRTGRLNIWFNRTPLNGGLTSTHSIVDEETPKEIIYPNPTSGFITIKTTAAFFSYRLYDTQGKLQLSKDKQQNNSIDIGQLKKGIYFLQVDYETKSEVFRVIKE